MGNVIRSKQFGKMETTVIVEDFAKYRIFKRNNVFVIYRHKILDFSTSSGEPLFKVAGELVFTSQRSDRLRDLFMMYKQDISFDNI